MFGREHGVKIGSGGMATDEMLASSRQERLRMLASEVYNIEKDPYFFRNTAGKIVCRLCDTSHPNEQNYITHTQATKHRQNLILRQNKMNKGKTTLVPIVEKKKIVPKKTEKFGRPGYDLFKQYSRETHTHSILVRVMYPEIADGVRPRIKIMSAFEQRQEPTDTNFQYLLFAAEPYNTIAFKIPAGKIDRDPSKFLTHWNEETCIFTLQLHYTSVVYHPELLQEQSVYNNEQVHENNEIPMEYQ